MDFVLDHKWFFLVAGEIIFWVCAIGFLLVRYWLKQDKMSMFLFIIFIINDLWIALLAFMDYQRTGEVSTYQIIVIGFITYAMTLGKSDFKKLDHFIKRKVAEIRGEPVDEMLRPQQLYGMAYALWEWKQFAGHLLIFLVLHSIFFMTWGFSDSMQQVRTVDLFELLSDKDATNVPFNYEGINKFSQVWVLILLVDFVITLSYTIIPKRNPTSEVNIIKRILRRKI